VGFKFKLLVPTGRAALQVGTSLYGQEKYIKKIKKIVELYLKKLYEY
jgi:hypothetical protein